jgi:hypothetical protein
LVKGNSKVGSEGKRERKRGEEKTKKKRWREIEISGAQC